MGKKKDRHETKKSTTTPKSTKRRKINKERINNDIVSLSCKVEKDTIEENSKDMIVHISLFLSNGKSTSPSVVNDTSAMEVDNNKDNNGKEEQLLDSISYLVNFIENDKKECVSLDDKKTTTIAIDITKEDVATLLLPWSIAFLMRKISSTNGTDNGDSCMNNDELLAWRTVSCSLDILLPTSSASQQHETLLSNSLSQSTLNRLLPYATQIVFTDTNSSNIQGCASNSYQHLIKRYHPTLDNACTTLLHALDSLIVSNHYAKEGKKVLSVNQTTIVTSTLQLIHNLLSKSNHKKMFGTICSILPCLGRLKMAAVEDNNEVNKLIKEIIYDGLFDNIHHMEGFRAISELQTVPTLSNQETVVEEHMEETNSKEKKKEQETGKKKSSFQSALFTSISSLFSPTVSGEGDMNEKKDAIATANILPVIIQGFFERIREGSIGSTTTTAEVAANTQFRFWCNIMTSAFEQLFRFSSSDSSSSEETCGELALALLSSVSETLGMVLNYDAYLPSYNDPNEQHLKYLECVTSGILQCIKRDVTPECKIQAADKQMLVSLRHILLLNHRLLHDRLDRTIYFASSLLSSEVSSQANELLGDIVKTYKELRQVGYFLSSTHGVFANNDDEDGLSFMSDLLNCGSIMESLSTAYQICPSGQIHEIWNFFDGWIADIVDQKIQIDVDNSASTELSFAIQMFITFIKNIRASKHNSRDLRRLCETSMVSTIPKLLGKDKADGDSPVNTTEDSKGGAGIHMSQGFDLCGWLVDLHTRSCFWIDSIKIDDQGSSFLMTKRASNISDDATNVLAYLHNVMETTLASELFKKWKSQFVESYWQSTGKVHEFIDIDIPISLRGSLQRLALHRIQQLHSMIYYCNLQENERQEDDLQGGQSSSRALVEEARKLVDLSLYIASSQLSRHKSSIVPNDHESSESLWSSVAQSLSIWTQYCEPFHAEIFMVWFFTALCQPKCPTGLPDKVFQLEKTIALTLARDVSFYDVGQVMSVFMRVGLQYALNQFLDSIDITSLMLKTLKESSCLTKTCIELVENESDIKLAQVEILESVSQALSFMASAPLELSLCNENLNLLDLVVGLDILSSHVMIQAVDGRHEERLQQLSNIICSTRGIMSNLLSKSLLSSSSNVDAPCLVNITSHMFKSCADIEPANGGGDICLASRDVVAELFSLCIDNSTHRVDISGKNPSMLIWYLNQVSQSIALNISIGRHIIRRMNMLGRRHILSTKTNNDSNISSYELCMKFVLETQESFQKSLFGRLECLSKEMSIKDEDDTESTSMILLASETLSFIANHLTTNPDTNLMSSEQIAKSKENVQTVYELVTQQCQHSQSSLEFTSASSYFLAAMAVTPTFFLDCIASPSEVLKCILDLSAQSFTSGQASPLLDAALCSLIRNANVEQTQTITDHVLSRLENGNTKGSSSAFVTKMFHLLVTCANNQEQHKFIAGKCKTFLLISMSILRDTFSIKSSNVELFSNIMTTLISKKQLLLLSGREIAMICCEMNALFYHDRAKHYGVENSTSIFHSCCLVVASLIARYPKQLYGCPSPLFSLLLSLLSDILQTSVKKGLSQKALEYAK